MKMSNLYFLSNTSHLLEKRVLEATCTASHHVAVKRQSRAQGPHQTLPLGTSVVAVFFLNQLSHFTIV